MSLISDGTVSVAGTYAGNTIAVAAATAALDELSVPGIYEALFRRCERFYAGLEEIFADAGLPAHVAGIGPVLQVWFSEHPIHNYRDAARHASHHRFRLWWEGMLERGVLFHPGAFENLFVSFAHDDDDIDQTLAAARRVAADLQRSG
jgi:glutamate-1-semialdehyde 2,1-aminomutase